MLSDEQFESLINNTPLFSKKIVIMNERSKIFFGKRASEFVKGFWFAPSGQVYKNKILESSFIGLTKGELGSVFKLEYTIGVA